MMSLQSSSKDSSLEDEKARNEDRPSSSHLPTRSWTIQMNRKCSTTANANLVRTAVYWINLARVQDKGPQFSQKRAAMVCSSVPADCMNKVISQKGERT